MRGQLTIVATLLAITGLCSCSLSPSDEQIIREKLLESYDKHVFPSQHFNDSISAKISFTLMDIEMDTEREVMELSAYITLEWPDYRLNFETMLNDSNTNTYFRFRRDEIWVPDISLYNGARSYVNEDHSSDLIVASPSGGMLYVYDTKLSIPCYAEMAYWPKDTHHCQAVFGSWTFDANKLNITILPDPFGINYEIDSKKRVGSDDEKPTPTKKELESGKKSGEWKLVGKKLKRVLTTYECCPEPYVSVKLNLKVQRTASVYSYTVQRPAIGLSVVTAVVFLLPPGATEKVIAGMLNLVANIQFLSYVNQMIPYSPNDTPYLVQFVSDQILLTVLVVLVSVIIIRLARQPHPAASKDMKVASSPQQCCNKLMSVLTLGLCLCNYRRYLSSQPRKDGSELDETLKSCISDNNSSSSSSTTGGVSYLFLVLAAIIDRLCLVIFLVQLISNAVVHSDVLFY